MLAALALSTGAVWLLLGHGSLSTSFVGAGLGGDFTLQSATGYVSTQALRGNVLLLYFGYTSCPDVCPTTLAEMGRALNALSRSEQEQVRGLFISVDPERDTPSRLAEYVQYFHRQILGVTGTDGELLAVASRYGATYRRTPLEAGDYAMEHPASVYIVDPAGALVGRITHGATTNNWVTAIRSALQGQRLSME